MRVMRAVESPDVVVWHVMAREDTAVCGVALPQLPGAEDSQRREAFCPQCMSGVEREMGAVAAPPAVDADVETMP